MGFTVVFSVDGRVKRIMGLFVYFFDYRVFEGIKSWGEGPAEEWGE